MKKLLSASALGLVALILTFSFTACKGGKEWTDVYSKEENTTIQQNDANNNNTLNGNGQNANQNITDNDWADNTVDNSDDFKKEQNGSWLDWPIWIWNWFDGDDKDDTNTSSQDVTTSQVSTSSKTDNTTSQEPESSSKEEVSIPSEQPTVTSKPEPSSSQKPTSSNNDGWTGDYIINTKPRK